MILCTNVSSSIYFKCGHQNNSGRWSCYCKAEWQLYWEPHHICIYHICGTAVFVLNLSSVTGNLCIRVVVAHQSLPNRPLNTLEQQLTFRSCPIAPINSVASCSVSVEFSLAESSGQVPHGTIATFKPLSVCTDQLVGAERATCFNGVWSDLSQRTSSCKSGKVNWGDFVCEAIPYARILCFTMRVCTEWAGGIPSSYW